MKRILISLFTLCVCWFNLYAQSGEFDPASPGDPQPFYTLTVQVSPAAAGEANISRKIMTVGQEIDLYVNYNNGAFTFLQWVCGDSVLSSDNEWCHFTMPARNVVVTAQLVRKENFDPASPPDPESQEAERKHLVTIYCTPSIGGYTNQSAFYMSEWEQTQLYAFNNAGYEFVGWYIGERLESLSNPVTLTMQQSDITLTARFRFNPLSPNEPGANRFDAATGEMVIDRFTPGRLNEAIYALLHDDYSAVTSVTVIGEMESSDYGFYYMGSFSNLETIDMSRTTGYTEVPAWAFSSVPNLQRILLPSSIETIGSDAFYGCSHLQEIMLYAPVPPTYEPVTEDYGEWGTYGGEDLFASVTGQVILRVPSSSIALYQASSVWNVCNILPMDMQSLQIVLPADKVSLYENMFLELMDTQSGQVRRYVITDRNVYTFIDVFQGTTYQLNVRNAQGRSFAQEMIALEQNDTIVPVTNLLLPVNITLQVMAGEVEVTDQVTITWRDNGGKYLLKGAKLDNLVENDIVVFQLVLDESLGTLYLQPTDQSVIVNPQSPQVVFSLAPIQERIFEGYVTDETNQLPVSDASVAIAQTVNGKYNKLYSGTTDQSGHFAITALNAPSQLIVSASDYAKSTTDIPDSIGTLMVTLQRLTGTTITLDINYADFRNLRFAVYNRTQEKDITQFEILSSSLRLEDVVNIGDSLELTISSLTNAVVPVMVAGRVSEANDMRVTFSLVERGGLAVSCESMPQDGAIAMLYNAAGLQTAQAWFDENHNASIEHIQAGLYTLVLMQRCERFGHLARLEDLNANELQENRDYLTEQVNIQDGITTYLHRDTIPAVNEQLIAYTDAATSFTINKTSVTSGNYLTLRAQVQFKSQYKNNVDSVRLVLDLPEGINLVENAILIGSSPAEYTQTGNQVIVPLPNSNEAVRLCVIPTQAGQFYINANVLFSLGEAEQSQTIGSVACTVENASLQVQVLHSKAVVLLNGMTTPLSQVEIYDNGTLIGRTKAKAGGLWNAECNLYMPYNLTTHELYAQITTPDGMRLQTTTESVFLNKEQPVELLTVEMNLRNHSVWMTPIIWDFVKGTKNATYYAVDPDDMNFRFVANFSDNTSPLLSDVCVLVYMENHRFHRLPLTYNPSLDRWVGYDRISNINDCPVNVGVEYKLAGATYSLDADFMDKAYALIDAPNHVMTPNEVDTLLSQLDAAIAVDDYTTVDSIFALLVPDKLPYPDEEELDVTRLIQENDSIAQTPLYQTDFNLEIDVWMDSINAWTEGISITDCQGIDTVQLAQAGYERMQKTDSTFVYLLVSENVWHIVDMEANISYSVDLTSEALVPRQLKAIVMATTASADKPFITQMNEAIAKIERIKKEIDDKLYSIREKYVAILKFFHINEHVETISNWKSAVENANKVAESVDKEIMRQYNVLKKENRSITSFINKGKADDSPAVKNKLKQIRHTNATKIANKLDWHNNWFMKHLQISEKLKAVNGVFNLIMTASSMVDDLNKCVNLYHKAEGKKEMLECQDAKITLIRIQSRIEEVGLKAMGYYVWKITQSSAELATVVYGLAAAVPSGGASLAGVALAVTGVAIDISTSLRYSKTFKERMKQFETAIDKVSCQEPNPPMPPASETASLGPITSDLGKGIDPSGFVYEATENNRIQGVQASIYYKGSRENIFGEIVEEDVLWDASEFDQENPLYTDEEGMYRWDVPQGLWQVRFEKEGYEPAQSDWLPVPPPQLDVNIPMVQLRQPEVLNAIAMKDAIDITFDKFMKPALLTTNNIFVTANGQLVEGTVVMLDEQPAYGEQNVTYASKVRFVPNENFTANEVTLTISNRVHSYASVPMAQTFQQTFDIANTDVMQQVEAPIASLPTGTLVEQGTEIELTCATEGAVIRYTIDESTPDATSGYIYAQPIVLFGQHHIIVTAVAYAEGYNPSEVVQWYFSFDEGTDLKHVEADNRPYKLVENGQIVILKNGIRYNILGIEIK